MLGPVQHRARAVLITAFVAVLALAVLSDTAGAEPARSDAGPAVSTVKPHWMLVGRSEQGRAILADRVGNPDGPRVLVFGCIHGNETAGIAIARSLERVRTVDDVWIVPDLNPDGVAHATRQDARGVDLNANWSSEWERGGVAFDPYYGGPHPFSERETAVARALILRFHPRLTVWYHQHMNVVWAYGPSTTAGRMYARATGMRLYHHHWLPGTSTNWQNHHLAGTAALTVELPGGVLTPRQILRHERAVLSVTRALAAS
jgi:predicted deacylase